MAEPSTPPAEPKRPSPFTRGRLAVGVFLVGVVAVLAAVGAAKVRSGPDAGRLVYISDRGVVVRNLGSGAERTAAAWPGNARGPVLDTANHRLAYRVGWSVQMLDLDTGRRIEVAEGRVRPLGFDRRGRLVLAHTDVGRTGLALVDGGRERAILAGEAAAFSGGPVWLTDDRYAVPLLRPQRPTDVTRIVDIGGTEPAVVREVERSWPLLASPDGTELLHSVQRGDEERLEILDVASGRSRRAGATGGFRSARLNPSGVAALLGIGPDPAVWTYAPASEQAVRVVRARASAVTWSLDGSHLLYADGRGVWTVAGGDRRRILGPVRSGFLGTVPSR